MHDMAQASFASPAAATAKTYGRTCLTHTQGRWAQTIRLSPRTRTWNAILTI